MERFRFDDAYQKVYIYSSTEKAYVFLASYYQIDISPEMPKEEKIRIAEEYIEMDMYYQE